jgi:hypothetical protein
VALCSPTGLAAQTVSGRVLDAATDAPIREVTVTLLDAGRAVTRAAATDSTGVFSLRLPRAGRYQLRAERLGYASVTTPPLEFLAGDSLALELRLSSEVVPLEPLAVTIPARRTRGIAGRLLDAATDAPIRYAAVALLDAREAVVRTMWTDSAGTFALPVSLSGRYHLRAERLGYETVTSPPVDMASGDTLVVELRMSTRAVPLAPLTVTAASRRTVRDRALDGFYQRQRAGWGTFFGPDDIERLRPAYVVNLLQMLPGVRVEYLRGMETRVLMRAVRGDCAPTIYIDGMRLTANLDIEGFVTASSLRAVEVYRRGMLAPAEFASVMNYDCGVIVIWTALRTGW